jgi:hypothetical protein
MNTAAIEDVLLLAGAKRLPQLNGQISVKSEGPVKLQLIRTARMDVKQAGRVIVKAETSEPVIEEVLTQAGKQPFSIVLPSQSQPSLHAQLDDPLGLEWTVDIEYVLSVLHMTTQTELVRRPVTLNFSKQQGLPINVCEETRVSSHFWCCIEDPASHLLTLINSDSDTACAGGSWNMFAEIYNYSKHVVDKIQVKLERVIEAEGTRDSEIINLKEFKGIEPGRFIPSFPLSLQVPVAALPSLDLFVFSCKYFVEIKAIISHAHDVSVRIPVNVIPVPNDRVGRPVRQSG